MLNQKLSHEGILRATGITSCTFFDLDSTSRWKSASWPCRFIAGERESRYALNRRFGGEGCVLRRACLDSLEKKIYLPYAGYRNGAPWSAVYSLFTIKTAGYQLQRGRAWTLKGPGNRSTCGEENSINNADLGRKPRQGLRRRRTI